MSIRKHLRARESLDKRLAPFRDNPELQRPSKGWLRAIRNALGLTTDQLAQRAGISQYTVSKWEKAEMQDSMTLRKLREAAEALDCELVYTLVPRQPLSSMVRHRAEVVADALLARNHHTMLLEAQSLSKDEILREREQLIDDLLRLKPARLWDPIEVTS